MSDVADTTVVPGTLDVIVTVQLAVAAPPAGAGEFEVGLPAKLPGPLTIAAVGGNVPASSSPLTACTVIVSTWFVVTGFVALDGVISIHASTHFLLALPLPPAAVLSAVAVVRGIV